VLNAILPWFVILLAITGSMFFCGVASNPVKPMHDKQANPHPDSAHIPGIAAVTLLRSGCRVDTSSPTGR